MKTYIVTYFRHNPQLKNGGYTSTCKIEAASIASARKKAREFCEGAVYGSRVPSDNGRTCSRRRTCLFFCL